MSQHELLSEILNANERIQSRLAATPFEQLHGFSDHPTTTVLAKLENLQPTGSFKLRGVINKLELLDSRSIVPRVVAASTGNHGIALAYASEQQAKNCLIFVPESASPAKTRRIEQRGGTLIRKGHDASETESYARAYAQELGQPFISPYNDRDVIAGQGSLACEIHRQFVNQISPPPNDDFSYRSKPSIDLNHHQPCAPASKKQIRKIDAIFVPVGGGGLVSGIAAYFKSIFPLTQIVGCSPSHSKVMMESVKWGKILDLPSKTTFSDGTAGGIEENSITFELCRTLVDRFIEVSEAEIASAVRRFIDCRNLLIEGAAGVALAAFLKSQSEWQGKTVVIVVSGGNIDAQTLKQMLNTEF